MKKLSILFFVLFANIVQAQKNEVDDKVAYQKTITERAAKIANALSLGNDKKTEKVTFIIRDQYSNLNDIYIARDGKLKEIKASSDSKAEKDTAIAQNSRLTQQALAKLHKKYIQQLSKQLNADQIDAVKNGMTYGVLPLTYKAYQEEILTLTDEQKKQIWTWLVEAREYAMDAESSDKKHAWFGKYKGRINNYLSAAGYDLKKEGQEWEKRRKASTQTN